VNLGATVQQLLCSSQIKATGSPRLLRQFRIAEEAREKLGTQLRTPRVVCRERTIGSLACAGAWGPVSVLTHVLYCIWLHLIALLSSCQFEGRSSILAHNVGLPDSLFWLLCWRLANINTDTAHEVGLNLGLVRQARIVMTLASRFYAYSYVTGSLSVTQVT
jgi:hypothetical protein